MKMAAHQIEEWLYENRRKIILCPYQAGNLRISLWGCQRRRSQANKVNFTDLMKGDYFDYAYKNGLLRCRKCRIATAASHAPARRDSAHAARAIA